MHNNMNAAWMVYWTWTVSRMRLKTRTVEKMNRSRVAWINTRRSDRMGGVLSNPWRNIRIRPPEQPKSLFRAEGKGPRSWRPELFGYKLPSTWHPNLAQAPPTWTGRITGQAGFPMRAESLPLAVANLGEFRIWMSFFAPMNTCITRKRRRTDANYH